MCEKGCFNCDNRIAAVTQSITVKDLTTITCNVGHGETPVISPHHDVSLIAAAGCAFANIQRELIATGSTIDGAIHDAFAQSDAFLGADCPLHVSSQRQ